MVLTIDSLPWLDWLNLPAFNGWWIIFWFILFGSIIFIVVKYLTSILEILASKIRVSKIFLGGIVMSLVTSLPELVASVYGGLKGDPMFSLYNETGSNMMQLFLLSVVLISFFIYYSIKSIKIKSKMKQIDEIYNGCFLKQEKNNKLLIIFLLVFYFILIFFIEVPQIGEYLYIPGVEISIVSIIPFLFWVFFCFWTFFAKNSSTENYMIKKTKMYSWKLWILIPLFFILSVILVWFSYVNSGVVDKFSEIFKISSQSAATIFLSIPTSLPEVLTMFFLFRHKQYSLGFSTLVGGGLTNSSFLFYTDCIVDGSTFKLFHENYLNPEIATNDVYISALRMQYWIPVVFSIYLLLYLTSIKKIAKSSKYITINLFSIFFVYLVGFILITTLVNG